MKARLGVLIVSLGVLLANGSLANDNDPYSGPEKSGGNDTVHVPPPPPPPPPAPPPPPPPPNDRDKDNGGAGVGPPTVHGCDSSGCFNNPPQPK